MGGTSLAARDAWLFDPIVVGTDGDTEIISFVAHAVEWHRTQPRILNDWLCSRRDSSVEGPKK